MDSDFNLLKPSPGGASATPAQALGPATRWPEADPNNPLGPQVGVNSLVACANDLLYIASRIRHSQQHQDSQTLRDFLAAKIRNFEDTARAQGIRHENVIAARYVLCTVLDEFAASTPWGGSGSWGRHSLLVSFHNETWGGEKVFQLMSKLAENPAGNRDLLELIYICLCLGFEGRYRVIDGGAAQLDTLRRRLLELLRQQRGEYEHALSPHWTGVSAEVKRKTIIPLWVGAALVAALLMLVFFAFSILLNSASDPVFGAIQSIRSRAPALALDDKPAAQPRLAKFLEREIAEGLVTVADHENRSVVTILGDGLFESGSAELRSEYLPVLDRIGTELTRVKGQVLVTGHTDNQPVRSFRYPSNWHLSKARAEAVRDVLAGKVEPQRLLLEGRSDSDPVAANDSAANRARNRRVEITLFVAK